VGSWKAAEVVMARSVFREFISIMKMG